MSTSYDRLPTLEERIRASSFIVTGRVRSIEPLQRTRLGDTEEEQAVAHVEADKVLRGAVTAHELSVRFVRSRGASSRPEAEALRGDKRLLLLMVPDVGPNVLPGTFVAYLGGAYVLSPNDSFTIETDSSSSKGRRRTRQTLAAVRALVKAIDTEHADDARAWEKGEPYLAKRPAPPPVTELPDTGPGTGPMASEPTSPAVSRPRPIRRQRRRR